MNHIEIKEIAKNVLIVDAKSLARELMNAITKLVNYLITRNVFKSPKKHGVQWNIDENYFCYRRYAKQVNINLMTLEHFEVITNMFGEVKEKKNHETIGFLQEIFMDLKEVAWKRLKLKLLNR